MKHIHIIVARDASKLKLSDMPVFVYREFNRHSDPIGYANLKATEWGLMAEITVRPVFQFPPEMLVGLYPDTMFVWDALKDETTVESISLSGTPTKDPLISPIHYRHIVEAKKEPEYMTEAQVREVIAPVVKSYEGAPDTRLFRVKFYTEAGKALDNFILGNPQYKKPNVTFTVQTKTVIDGLKMDCKHKPEVNPVYMSKTVKISDFPLLFGCPISGLPLY